METKKLNCVNCGSSLQIPEDLEFINCSNCGSFLKVQHGEGYWALKLVGKTNQISDTSPVPVSISNESRTEKPEASHIPPEDKLRPQLDQEISNLKHQLETVGAEIRMLSGERATASITRQISDLRWQEFNLLEDWRILLGRRYALDTPDLSQNIPFMQEQISVLNLEIELISNSFMQNDDMQRILKNLQDERSKWVDVLSTVSGTSGDADGIAHYSTGKYSGLKNTDKSGFSARKNSIIYWILAGVCVLAVITAGILFLNSLKGRNSAPSLETPAANANTVVENFEDTVQDSSPALSENVTLKVFGGTYNETGEDVSQFIDEFIETHPNVTIDWESAYTPDLKLDTEHPIDGYDIVIRLILSSYDPLADQFAPLGNAADLKEKYRFVYPDTNEGQAYGLGTYGQMSGLLYNSEVFKAAGINTLPKTPGEFLADLKLIKQKTAATPLFVSQEYYYMGGWDNFAISVAGDPEFWETLVQNDAPFSAGEPLYELNKILYDAVKSGYSNDASTEMTMGEGLSMLVEGKVGVLGCDVGSVYDLLEYTDGFNADTSKTIGLMPFPATINGKQYVEQTQSSFIGMRKDSPHQKIAREFITAFLDYPDFTLHQDKLPGLIYAAEIPSLFKNYKDPNMKFVRSYMFDFPMIEENVPLLNSQLFGSGQLQKSVVDAASGKSSRSFDEIMDEANAKLAAARKSPGN